MNRRGRLLVLGLLIATAALPGCTPRREHVIVDQSWYARDPSSRPAPMPGPSGGDFEPKVPAQPRNKDSGSLRVVPPNLDPPADAAEIKNDPKPHLFNPTSFPKKPVEGDGLPSLLLPPATHKAPPPSEPLTLALECILNNRHSEALEHLKKYDAPTQELFLRLLPLLARMHEKGLNNLSAAEVAVLNEQLQGLQTALLPRTELIIAKMCCCDWARAYGVYKPLPENHVFLAGTETRPGDQVQLYVELRNISSEPKDGGFETRLASSLELLDARGEQKWSYSFGDSKKPYLSKTRLHDYYVNYPFFVPHLPAGVYTLKLQVVDETRPGSRRVAHKTMEFRVTSLSSR